MAIARQDLTLQDGLGRALAGAEVYILNQPANTGVNPPSPQAALFANIQGTVTLAQPLITNGFGEAFFYADDSVLYTYCYIDPLFGPNPLVYPDQSIGGGGSGGTGLTPFAGTLLGTINGTNTVFTLTTNGTTPLTILPSSVTVWLNFPLIQGLGYSLALVSGQVQCTFANPPQPASGGNPADSLYAQGFYA
jgi:hypothetical protein